MGQVFLVVNPSTRGFLLSGVVPGSWYEAVTCIFRMKKAQFRFTRTVGQLECRALFGNNGRI